MKHCIVCGDKTDRPIAAALSHFYLYQEGQWKFLRGNVLTFGLSNGVHSTLCLAFPFYNTLRFWKYRRAKLVIPDGADVCIIEKP